ncbi:radical SAM protein [Dactylosporangium sp. NPDC051541]|uniref:radical SAM protein n=1 Tax=Dactylosporangium sp. NPDC051541 TaxID=3363977 RepID=UPI0037A65A56
MSQGPAPRFRNIELRSNDYRGDSVDLYINSVCNLQCKTCFLGDEYFRAGREMSLQNVTEIVRWAKNSGITDVAILGGEPSLHRNVGEVLAKCREIGIDSIRFVTNGSRPFRRLLKTSAREYMDVVYVSLDGPDSETNDAIRGHGAFDQAMRTIEAVSEEKIPSVITASITPASLARFESLLELAEASSCSRLNIHWVSPTGRASAGQLTISPEEWIGLCTFIEAYSPRRQDLRIDCQRAFVDVRNRGDSAATSCAVRDTSNLQFMPDGSVYACGLLVDQPHLNGYRWRDGRVLRADAPNELSICHNHLADGCPARTGVIPSLANSNTNFLPVCIYERAHDASS